MRRATVNTLLNRKTKKNQPTSSDNSPSTYRHHAPFSVCARCNPHAIATLSNKIRINDERIDGWGPCARARASICHNTPQTCKTLHTPPTAARGHVPSICMLTVNHRRAHTSAAPRKQRDALCTHPQNTAHTN